MNKLLILGSVGIDTIETPKATEKHLLGGSVTYAAYAASRHTKALLLSAIGSDSPYSIKEAFKNYNVDTDGVTIMEGNTLRWHGKYSEDLNNRETVSIDVGVYAHPEITIPESYHDSKYILLANLSPELQMHVIKHMTKAKVIATDTMDHWINSDRKTLNAVLHHTNVLIINESECKALSNENNIFIGIKKLKSALAKKHCIIVKRGSYGCVIEYEDKYLILPSYPVINEVDPTGAGDTFAGTFMSIIASSGKLDAKTIKLAAQHACVAASFCVENFGAKKLIDLSEQEYTQRLKNYEKMIDFIKL